MRLGSTKCTETKADRRIKKVVAKERAKTRITRTLIAVPLLGSAIYTAIEINNFCAWKKDNPAKSKADYSCETAKRSAEVIDEVLLGLPATKEEKFTSLIDSFLKQCPKNKRQ